MTDVGRPTYEPPTVEGRAVVDLGHQVERLRADNDRLRATLELALQMVTALSIPRVDIAATITAALKTP